MVIFLVYIQKWSVFCKSWIVVNFFEYMENAGVEIVCIFVKFYYSLM